MAGALLVTDQDVLDFALLEDLVIDRKHRAARIAENVLHAVVDERAHDHRGAGHLVRIVALVGHGRLRIASVSGFVVWVSRFGQFGVVSVRGRPGNKKGPWKALRTARIMDGR